MIYLHSANSQNLDILDNIEILARTRPIKNGPYGHASNSQHGKILSDSFYSL